MNINLFKEMMELQDTCNLAVDESWKTKRNDWGRAIRAEAAEAVDSCAWKWWKAMDVNYDNVKVELVDIWHFILSIHLELGTPPENLLALVETGYNAESPKPTEMSDKEFLTQLIEHLAMASYEPEDSATLVCVFGGAWKTLGLPLNDLYTDYMTKNILNIFRQNNGYKDGTYIKSAWVDTITGELVEDNVTCFQLAKIIINSGDISNFANKLNDALTGAYSVVLENSKNIL